MWESIWAHTNISPISKAQVILSHMNMAHISVAQIVAAKMKLLNDI